VFLTDPSVKAGKPVKLSSLDFGADSALVVYLEHIKFPLLVYRQVFKNEEDAIRSEGEASEANANIQYLSTSDLSLTPTSMSTLYQKRWKVEEYHKSLKSNASFAKSPTKRVRTQSNHFIASILAFVKLESIRLRIELSHFAIKGRLYRAGLAKALDELANIKAGRQSACYHIHAA
jgi:hypothetical protein